MADAERPRPTEPPDRVWLPLLTLITHQALDEDYQQAAERKAAGAPRPPAGRPARVAAVVIGVFGLLVATAFAQTSRNADVDSASRETLIARIDAATDRRARQEERVAELRERVNALDSTIGTLTDQEQSTAVEERRLQVGTGFIAVTGEGLRITITQPPDADENEEVQDRDLRLATNGLFEAGAEAVSVNGQRMTSTTAIRTSGAAIEVNSIVVVPPYEIEAIGDLRTLPARYAESTTGQQLVATAELYGFEVDVQNVDDLRLPAAPPSQKVLRSVIAPGRPPRIEEGGTS